MKSSIGRVFDTGWVAPFSVLAAIGTITWLIRLSDTVKSEVIAAWVQGIGSLLAIIAAVAIYWRQVQDKKADDAAQITAFVQAIRHEIYTLWNRHVVRVGTTLTSLGDGELCGVLIPTTPNSMVIYDHSPAMIGRIDAGALRDAIVMVYALFREYLSDIEMNNTLLAELDRFRATYRDPDVIQQMDRRRFALGVLAGGMKRGFITLQNDVPDLLVRIDAWLANHPPC